MMRRQMLSMGALCFLVLVVLIIGAANLTDLDVPLWAQMVLAVAACGFLFFSLFGPKKVTADVERSVKTGDGWDHEIVTEVPGEFDLKDYALHIVGAMMDLWIPLDRIKAVEKRTELSVGKRKYGNSNGKQASGVWNNAEWGDYGLSIDSRTGVYIVVRYKAEKGSNIAVFNLEDAEKTRIIYERLKAFIA